MTDMFTVKREYDRDLLLADVDRIIGMGGDIYAARRFLDMMYTGWQFDQRTSFMVELRFRDKNDMFFNMFTKKLAELEAKEAA